MKNSDLILKYYNQYQYPKSKKFLKYIDQTPPKIAMRIEKILIDELKKQNKEIDKIFILDAGTSLGWTFIHWVKTFKNIIGTDMDQKALAITKNRMMISKPLIVCDFMKLPFKNKSFDVIISNTTVEDIANPKLMISEFYRLLKNNGFLYYSTANKLWFIEPHYQLPFLSYLPKKMANKYLKIMKLNCNYDDINLPTYNMFCKYIDKYFTYKDITYNILRHPEKYNLIKERGKSVLLVKFLLKLFGSKLYIILRYFSMGWIFICYKKNK